MASIRKKIEDWGKSNIENEDIQVVLNALVVKGMGDYDIARLFDCSVPAMRYWLRSFSLSKAKPTFEDRLKSLGYRDLKDFFTRPGNRQGEKTFKDLGKETGFCYSTVSKWYRHFQQTCLENL